MNIEHFGSSLRRVAFVCLFTVALISISAAGSQILPNEIKPTQAPQSEGSVPGMINVNGVVRTYRLYVPHNFRAGESALIIALHGRGGGGPGSALEQYSSLDRKADEERFAVAYPDALVDAVGTLNWNYYYDPFFTNPPDDIGFIRDLIDGLKATVHPNPRRIFVAGTSAGGFMAQRVGVELSDRVAAIGVVEGGLFVDTTTSPSVVPKAAAPISVVMLKGDMDPSNQYCGAIFPTFGITESSSDQDFGYWSGPSADRCQWAHPAGSLCQSTGVGNAQAVVAPGTPSTLVELHASSCDRNTEVILYRLIGGLDQWNTSPMNVPGESPFNPNLDGETGTTTNDILWNFFLAHPKDDDSDN